jgi:hypothetical protein
MVMDVASMLIVNYDNAMQLLLYFKFDKEKLLEGYYSGDAEAKLGKLGLVRAAGMEPLDGPDCSCYAAGPTLLNSTATCQICYDDFTISKNEDASHPCNVTGGFCCCCQHVLCTDCYVQYVCGKLHSEGINCLEGSNMSSAIPLFTCPGFKCSVLLPYSSIVKLLHNNSSPVTMVTSNSFAEDIPVTGVAAGASSSSATGARKAGKTVLPAPAKPSTVTHPASYYFDKYVEYIAKYYIKMTKGKYVLAPPSISIGSNGAKVAPRVIDAIQYCPCATCSKIAVIGKIPIGPAAQSSAGVHNAQTNNPIVSLQHATNVRCSECWSSYCLLCQQGGHTEVTLPGKGGADPTVVNRMQLHVPASCTQYAMWLEKITTGESDTANWLLLNTKRCPGPKCSSGASTRIEKNQGCNHMTCKVS